MDGNSISAYQVKVQLPAEFSKHIIIIIIIRRDTDEAECKSHSTQVCPNTPSGLLILIVLCMCMCVCSCFIVLLLDWAIP